MRHRVASVLSYVVYESKAALRDALRLGDLAGCNEHRGERFTVCAGEVRGVDDMCNRDDEHMGRSHRRDVAKGNDLSVSKNYLARYLTTNDAAEDAFFTWVHAAHVTRELTQRPSHDRDAHDAMRMMRCA